MMTHEAPRLATRPEARWAFWCGGIGGATGALFLLQRVLGAQGFDAALGFIFIPLMVAGFAATAGIWGAALGHVVLQLRGKVHEPGAVFIAALMAAVALPAVAGYELWRLLP